MIDMAETTPAEPTDFGTVVLDADDQVWQRVDNGKKKKVWSPTAYALMVDRGTERLCVTVKHTAYTWKQLDEFFGPLRAIHGPRAAVTPWALSALQAAFARNFAETSRAEPTQRYTIAVTPGEHVAWQKGDDDLWWSVMHGRTWTSLCRQYGDMIVVWAPNVV